MSYKDVGSRRLNLQAALGSILRAMPGLWLGAAGALLVCTAVWLVPVFVALTGWTGPVWAFAAGLTTLVAVGGLARLSVTEDVRAARPDWTSQRFRPVTGTASVRPGSLACWRCPGLLPC